MFWINTIISLVCTAIIVGVSYLYFKKRALSGSSAEQDALVAEVNKVNAQLDALAEYAESYVSRKQIESLASQIEKIKTELATEKENLKATEAKLATAQKSVEEKESQQQELKSSKEEDEAKIEEILSQYSNISSESTALEQKLALSLRNLDTILSEVKMNEEQKAVLIEFQNSLTEASSRLRDLIMEYATVHERLENLKAQHVDLEDEYTKLVEQQLGA